MAFSESLKLKVRRKSHFQCCLCKSLGVEIHHIIPQAEGGDDTEENAAPLCPSCHETYGQNPTKRKFIREVRDHWYELCDQRYCSDLERLERIAIAIESTATKDDLEFVKEELIGLIRDSSKQGQSVEDQRKQIAASGAMLIPGLGVNRTCTKCGTQIGLYVGDEGKCPECGTPW